MSILTKTDILPLIDQDAWDAFVIDNYDALIDQCGSIDAAFKVCCDGGLVMGGGAAPMTHIYFVED